MKNNILSNVMVEHHFWLKDGTAIKSLNELYQAMSGMSEDMFKHHVNEQRNDFYNWVRDIHKDRNLAGNLLKAKTREEAAGFIRERIREVKNAQRTGRAETRKDRKTRKTAKKQASQKKKEKPIEENLVVEIPQVQLVVPETANSLQTNRKGAEDDKPYTIAGMLVALAVLIAVVALINIFGKPSITGAAVTSPQNISYNWFVIAGIIVVIIVAPVVLGMVRRLK